MARQKAAGNGATAAAALRRTREQSAPAAVPPFAGDEMAVGVTEAYGKAAGCRYKCTKRKASD